METVQRPAAVLTAEIASSYGDFFLRVTRHGVHSLQFPGEKIPREALEPSPSERAEAEKVLKLAKDVLSRYLKGEGVSLNGIPVDLTGGYTPFEKKVLETLARSPRGELISYAGLAARAGYPGCARAIGQVMGKNRIPVIIPCHRVLRSDGSIGGYSGGLLWKRRLLALEGIRMAEQGSLDLGMSC